MRHAMGSSISIGGVHRRAVNATRGLLEQLLQVFNDYNLSHEKRNEGQA